MYILLLNHFCGSCYKKIRDEKFEKYHYLFVIDQVECDMACKFFFIVVLYAHRTMIIHSSHSFLSVVSRVVPSEETMPRHPMEALGKPPHF